jgi:hypothetical protein
MTTTPAPVEDDGKRYKIIRFHQFGGFDGDGYKKTIAYGQTREEAQEHCRREDTHGNGWFDGYEEQR